MSTRQQSLRARAMTTTLFLVVTGSAIGGVSRADVPPARPATNPCKSESVNACPRTSLGARTCTATTSTTRHTTRTRVERPPVNAFLTRVVATVGVATVFDQTFSAAPNSAEVQAGVDRAVQAAQQATACRVDPPAIVGQSQSTASPKVGELPNHNEVAVTSTTTCGPARVRTGGDRAQTTVLPEDAVNVNVNTHTETFVDEVFQPTVTSSATYRVAGTLCPH